MSVGVLVTLINSALNSISRRVEVFVALLGTKFVCLKKEGGLGLKNVEAFNLALLNKWRWRCLTDFKGGLVFIL